MTSCPVDHSPSGCASWLYMLERFDVGVINLDQQLRVVGMNEFARRTLPVDERQPFGKIVTSFHPEVSRAKVAFLLEQAQCPVSNPPPMTMIINIPERVLLIKVSKMTDAAGEVQGYTLVFHDITDAVSRDDGAGVRREAKRQLFKIPTLRQNRIVLVDVASVSYIRSDGHYTWVQTADGNYFCNLTIGDLEARLDPERFMRVHRSYIVNLEQAEQIVRDDGKVLLKLVQPEDAEIPVARASVSRLMENLGLAGAVGWR
ncbi:LytTR family transcriptional regulator DNA-binding domain-containing protein [Rhodocyclaceae bacterium SMB388]